MYINCNGRLLDFATPKVMGILNLTPDSFYSGSQTPGLETALPKVEKMLTEGASFIDIGAYSSRPGAIDISEEEELRRILPVVERLKQDFPEIAISIDTFRSRIAQECVASGAAMINDISAGNLDENMMETVGKLQVPYIMMHMRGTPKTMSSLTSYEDVAQELLFYFSEKIAKATALGIQDLIIDPGFGFSKTTKQNFQLLSHLKLFKNLRFPILSGISRKTLIYKTLETNSSEALNGTTVLNTVSLLKGAQILRVHDVKEAVECVKLVSQLPN